MAIKQFILAIVLCNICYNVSGQYLSIREPMLMTIQPNQERIVWECNFSDGDCGIVNQYNMKTQFQIIQNFLGKYNVYYLDVANAKSNGARLETPYIPANHTNLFACLGIEYHISGTGAKKLSIIQQNVRNECLWQTFNYNYGDNNEWKTARITINFANGEPRLFIDASIDSRTFRGGSIAISRLWLSYGECAQRDNNC